MVAPTIASRVRASLRRIGPLAWLVHSARERARARRREPARTPQGFLFLGNAEMAAGAFEVAETALLSDLLRRCDRFVDVGANIGFFSCLARSLARPVVAFEPLQENLRVFFENLRVNQWTDTEVHAAGLGEAVGVATLYGADTGASLLPGWAGAVPHSFLQHKIPINTLDNVIGGRFADERLLIKVDIEGGEFAMLRGAAHTLVRAPRPSWLVEITLGENRASGMNPDFAATFDLFFDRGYQAFAVAPDLAPVSRADVARWAREGKSELAVYNYLFTADTTGKA